MEIETKILRALADHLDVFATDNNLTIAVPGSGYNPTGVQYLRVSLLPARTSGITISHSNDYFGIFQVSVFWPASKPGIIQPMELAAKVAKHYVRGTILRREGVSVKINDPPYLSSPITEPGWISIPVSVPYRTLENPS